MNTKSNDDPKWPNIIQSGRFLQFTTNLTELIEIYDPNRAAEWAQYFKPLLGAPHLLSDIFVRRTRSIGWVRLHSNDPYVLPEINPNFFADKRDFDDLLEAFKFQLFFIANSHISKFVERYPVPVPPCAHLYCKDRPEWECDEYLKCYIIEIGDKEHHSVGTCRMGNPHRKDTVVDPQLRVKGVEGLRVCDASIAPLLPNANTNAMTIMIGEKCADMIKQGDHGASYSNSGYSGGVGNLVSSGASYITSDNSHLLYAKAKAA
jgi:choline dehydrogenase-like flavoprotein